MIEIRDANLRDASFVTANLRPEDHAEIFCQIPDGTSSQVLADHLIRSTPGATAFVAYYRGQPVALFGSTPATVCCLSMWAMGTSQMRRAIPAISAFYVDEHMPRRINEGFTSAEARSHVDHHQAHAWMRSLGAEQHGPSFEFGKGGERFILFRWTVAAYRTIRKTKWALETPDHVL